MEYNYSAGTVLNLSAVTHLYFRGTNAEKRFSMHSLPLAFPPINTFHPLLLTMAKLLVKD